MRLVIQITHDLGTKQDMTYHNKEEKLNPFFMLYAGL